MMADNPFHVSGLVIGIVETVEGDPLELGRIKLTYPTLAIASNWARVASFFAGAERGAYFPPMSGDEVLVAFELGDINKPYVIGTLWNGEDRPPVPPEMALTQKMIRTEAGLKLIMDEDPELLSVEITDGKGNSVTITGAENMISITSTGSISLKAAEAVSIEAPEISISAAGALSMSAEGEASLSAVGEASITGALVKLN